MQTIKHEVDLMLTPEQVASLFCGMDSEEMARFLNFIAEDAKTWNNPFCFQMQGVNESSLLTQDARCIMSEIGAYSVMPEISENLVDPRIYPTEFKGWNIERISKINEKVRYLGDVSHDAFKTLYNLYGNIDVEITEDMVIDAINQNLPF